MNKKVQIEGLWRLRREYKDYAENPPDGYEFIIGQSSGSGLLSRLARMDLAYKFQHTLEKFIPLNLLKPYLEKGKNGADLTYAVMHCIFRDEPWVLDMKTEAPHLLVGSERVFNNLRWRDRVRQLLMSDNCRAIICELEAEKWAMMQVFPEIADKLNVIHSYVPNKEYKKQYGKDKNVKLLFVNSANVNSSFHFYAKGGWILLDAYRILREKYNNIELVIRSGIPPKVKDEVLRDETITLYDEVIPWSTLQYELMTADIFVYPTHVTPSNVFLDAMNYELPIVTTELWGNGEIVKDGFTGLLAPHNGEGLFTEGYIRHFDSKEFYDVVYSPNEILSQAVADKVAYLIDSPDKRRAMGEVAKSQIEHGEFSHDNWSKNLKEVLDDAISMAYKTG